MKITGAAGVPGPSFDDFNVNNNTTYTYFLRAVFDGPQVEAVGEVKAASRTSRPS